jgi:PadR family transcriptional regulator PadR
LDNENAANKKFKKELSSGIAALVLLSVLDRADEPMYGYQIAKLIGAGEADVPIAKQGALYPVLRSLERSGLLQSQVEPSISGPPRRYYSITESGSETYRQWVEIWNSTKVFVQNAMEGTYRD